MQTIENAITESEGDGSVLEEWLKKTKFNINSYDTHGFALIHWAAQKGYTACIEMLIKHGADITNLTSVHSVVSVVRYRRKSQYMILQFSMAIQRPLSG